MTIIKCKMCGGDIALSADKTFGFCEYCGSGMTLPNVDNDQRAAAYNRGNHFRRIGEFDKALAVYDKIVSENDRDAEAHWCCALCRFGIEYVEDPNTMEWFPTCHRVSFDSFLEDVDYKAAVENSDGLTKRQYVKEGLKIAEVQKGILLTSQNTQPYDIFICYKESDLQGQRTRDSLLAQEIYYQLTDQGRSVFYSRITLENVAGTAYEPYIFAALNSAKVMIVVGTKPEYLSAPWVKNEWSRFLTLMKKDHSKMMLPCYRDMDPYDLPEQLGMLQSYDMSRIGFLPDLTRGIAKVLDSQSVPKESVIVHQNATNVEPLLRRAFLFLEDGDWKTADEYCEKVLDTMPENAEAYLGKLMAEKHIRKKDLLGQTGGDFASSANYRKAHRFGDDSMKAFLESACKDAAYYTQKRKLTEIPEGQRSKAFLKEMISEFKSLSGWRDADALAQSCREEIRKLEEQEKIRKQQEEQRQKAAQKKAKQVKKAVGILISTVCAVLAIVIFANSVVIPMLRDKKPGVQETPEAASEVTVPAAETQPVDPVEAEYLRAEALAAEGQIGKAAIAFGKLGDYKDARELAFALWQKIPYRQTVCIWETVNGEKMIHALARDGSVLVDCHTCEYCDNPIVSDLEAYHTSGYQNVVSVQASRYGIIGLRYDGTLILPDSKDPYYEELAQWTDLVGISVTCAEVNNKECDVYFGIRADGTVLSAGTNEYGSREVNSWRNIVTVVSSGIHTLGLKSDGTVVASGLNYDGQCDVEAWSDVVAIVTADHQSYGLKTDGTVAAVGSDPEGMRTKVSKWKNVAVLQQNPCRGFPAAFQQDGSFLGHWHMEGKIANVAAVYSDSYHGILILKKDGTLWGGSVSVGSRVAEWKDIQVPGAPNNPAGNGKNAAAVYDDAEKLLAAGETAKAAIAFGKLGDYSDARERSLALWQKIPYRQTVCIWKRDKNDYVIHALSKDGSVLVDAHICEHCGDGITDAEAAQYHTVKYEDIISIQSSRWGVIGLRMDGTLALPDTDFPYYRELSQWTDIIHICAGKYSMRNDNEAELFFGVRSDGTVVSAGEGSDSSLVVDSWTEIVCVKSSGAHVIGLKADGTVLSEGNNRYNQCQVQNWTDVIDIQVGSLQSFGLKADGSVLAVGYDSSGGIGKISRWRNVDILDQSNLSGWPVAIQKEGTFLGQWHRDEIYSDAAAVISVGYAEPDHFVVLRKDGTLWGDPVELNSRAAGWKDIQIPYMPEVPVGRVS